MLYSEVFFNANIEITIMISVEMLRTPRSDRTKDELKKGGGSNKEQESRIVIK